MSMRGYSFVLLGVVVAFGAGWLIGASGTSEVEQARDQHERRSQVAQAEALLLGARVSLFETNFGDAGERLDRALALVTTVQTGLRETGQAERAGRLEIVAAQIRDAALMARQFDGGAQTAIEGALGGLRAAMSTEPAA
jgi:hypothetical protein